MNSEDGAQGGENDTDHDVTTISENEIEAYPDGPIGVEVTVPVAVDLPRDVVELCQQRYTAACTREEEPAPEFVDFLWDVVEFEPIFTVNGEAIDMDSGQFGEDTNDHSR